MLSHKSFKAVRPLTVHKNILKITPKCVIATDKVRASKQHKLGVLVVNGEERCARVFIETLRYEILV